MVLGSLQKSRPWWSKAWMALCGFGLSLPNRRGLYSLLRGVSYFWSDSGLKILYQYRLQNRRVRNQWAERGRSRDATRDAGDGSESLGVINIGALDPLIKVGYASPKL